MLGPEIVVRSRRARRRPASTPGARAQWRAYRYTIVNRPVPDPFLARHRVVGARAARPARCCGSAPTRSSASTTSRRSAGKGRRAPPPVRRVFESRWVDSATACCATRSARARSAGRWCARSSARWSTSASASSRPGDMLRILRAARPRRRRPRRAAPRPVPLGSRLLTPRATGSPSHLMSVHTGRVGTVTAWRRSARREATQAARDDVRRRDRRRRALPRARRLRRRRPSRRVPATRRRRRSVTRSTGRGCCARTASSRGSLGCRSAYARCASSPTLRYRGGAAVDVAHRGGGSRPLPRRRRGHRGHGAAGGAAGRTIAAMQGMPRRPHRRVGGPPPGQRRRHAAGGRVRDERRPGVELLAGHGRRRRHDENSFVVLAGVAGLVAGAFSMASGEWISIRSQRELYENELRIEKEELPRSPRRSTKSSS